MGREDQLLTRGLGSVADMLIPGSCRSFGAAPARVRVNRERATVVDPEAGLARAPRKPFKVRWFDQAPIKRRRRPALAPAMLES